VHEHADDDFGAGREEEGEEGLGGGGGGGRRFITHIDGLSRSRAIDLVHKCRFRAWTRSVAQAATLSRVSRDDRAAVEARSVPPKRALAANYRGRLRNAGHKVSPRKTATLGFLPALSPAFATDRFKVSAAAADNIRLILAQDLRPNYQRPSSVLSDGK